MLKYLWFGLDDIKTMIQHYEQIDLTDSFLEQKRIFFNHVASYMEELLCEYDPAESVKWMKISKCY